jgi:hypothetical protein
MAECLSQCYQQTRSIHREKAGLCDTPELLCPSHANRHAVPTIHLVVDMYQAIRAARPAARALIRPSSSSCRRAISSSAIRLSDHGPKPPSLFGPGGKPGEVPTDFEQATGLERLQLLGEMEGVVIFDKEPLDSSRVGTLKDPILVPSLVCLSFHASLNHPC